MFEFLIKYDKNILSTSIKELNNIWYILEENIRY